MLGNMKWLDIFGNAPSMSEWKPEQYSKNITLIYPVTIPFNGAGIKLRFSNKYGKEKISINSYSVTKGEDILFKSSRAVDIEAGEEYTTDGFNTELYKDEIISVRFYLSEYTNMTSSVFTSGCLSGGICVEGDYTDIINPDHNKMVSTNWNYFLTDVYMLASEQNHTIICYGDSITAQDWPDYFYKCFMKNENNHTAVVRKAVSGTRLIRQYNCNKYRSYGIKGEVRFPHEFKVLGGDTILIQHGINDIIHPVGIENNEFRPWEDLPTSEEMINVLKYYIELSKKNNLKVYMGTLLPIEGWRTYADFREKLRLEVNEWIRSTNLIDGLVDFDMEVRDKQNLHSFASELDSGDHLHPSKKAYKLMGELAYRILDKNF